MVTIFGYQIVDKLWKWDCAKIVGGQNTASILIKGRASVETGLKKKKEKVFYFFS